MSTLVEESLSVSGILLGKTMGRSPELVRRFSDESGELADLEVRARMAGRWRMASVQMSFAIMPALVYWFAGESIASAGNAISIGTVVAFTTLQTRLLFPIQSLLSVGLEVQTSLALFGRIFEYLDLPVDIVERPGARALSDVRGDVRLQRRLVPLRRPTRRGRSSDIDAEIPAGTRTALVGETGSGKTTLAYLVARLYEPERGCVSIDGVDIRDVTLGSLAATRRAGLAGDLPVPRLDPREPALRVPGGQRRGDRRRGARGPDPRADRLAARRATTRPSASAATASRAARSSASRSPARCCATRPC